MQKILLLEDNPTDANLVSREIKNRWPNAEIKMVNRLAEARKLVQGEPDFNVALFDLNLPDGNGMDLLSELRDAHCEIPIIILTGAGSEEIAIAALKAGANDYIPKKPGFQKLVPDQIEFTVKHAMADQKHLSVLYVEHHKSDKDLTLHYFKKHAPQIHLTTVSTADEALTLLPEEGDLNCKFDVLLLDYRLPGLNALEISKIIRHERNLSIAIVIVTGQGDEKIAVEALKIGVDDYVVKHENYLLRMPSVITSAYRRKEMVRQQEALKLSETKYRLLADYAADWEYWINPEGEYIYISPACKKTSGYPPEAFLNNKNLLTEIALPEYRTLFVDHFSQKVKEIHKPIEFRILDSDGNEKWISHFCRPVYDENKNYVGKRGVNRDITEQKKAELELLQSETRFKHLFDDLGDAVYVTRIGGVNMGEILEVNPAAEIQSGYSRSELLKMNIAKDLSVSGSEEINLEKWDERLRSGENVLNTEKKRKKDGTEYWTEVIVTPIEFRGELSGLSINRDITERKKTEEILLKLNLAIKNSGDVIFITDKDGIITFINPEFTKMYGYTADEIVGKTTPRILKSGDFKKEEIEYFWNAILSKQELPPSQYRNKCKNGKLIDIESSADTIVDDNGEIIGFLAIQRDITERKRAEQIQQVILNISNATQTDNDLEETLQIIQKELGNLMDTKNFLVALYNEETDQIHLPYYQDEKDEISEFPAGKTLTELVIKQGKSLLIDVAEAKRLEDEDKIKKVGSESQIWLGVPLKIKGKVTGAFVVQSYSNPNAYTERDKNILEIISHQISISIERKRYEENLLTALDAAQESDRMKTVFLANMSHELRTPLNAIIGFSDVINEDWPIDEIVKFNKIINESGKHLLSIVEDIFDVTLIETGETKLEKEDVELFSILDNVQNIIKTEQQKLNKKNLNITLKIPQEDKYLVIHTDPSKLQQILINLLKNALKFTHKGHINYGYKKIANQDEPKLLFYVEDSGIGVPENQQEFVFDVFRQVEDSSTRTYGGTGLGLAISKKLTELLGGEIWLESEFGKGTVFYFTIPFEKSGIADNISKAEIKTNTGNSKKTVLIVEDIKSSYELLKMVLEKKGINTLRAKNGKEAIKNCNENLDIDLVLMDINMPVMNGYEATKQIKKNKPNLPIIAQTAYAIAGDRKKSIDAGCDDYITKPIKKEKLFEMIGKYFSW